MKSVAVVGASGAVGEVMVQLLTDRKFPIGSIKFLASARSAGKSIDFGGEKHAIEPLTGAIHAESFSPAVPTRRVGAEVEFLVLDAATDFPAPLVTGRRNLELLAAYDGYGAKMRIAQALDTVEVIWPPRSGLVELHALLP